MSFRLIIGAVALAAAGCGDIPADPDGTLERVRRQGVFKVGLVASGDAPMALDRQRLFLQRVAQATGARPQMTSGPMEPLLVKLEEGDLDLVIGELAPKSPWAKRVSFLPPLHEQVDAGGHSHVVAMTRNGENGWITLLYPEAQAVRARR